VEVIEYKIVMSKKLKVLEDYKGDTIIVRSEKDSCEFEGHIGSEYLFFVLAEDMINMCNHTILYHPFYQRRCKKLMRKVYRMQRRFYPLNPPLAQASTLVPISLKPVASV
jgi:hypothetical protein